MASGRTDGMPIAAAPTEEQWSPVDAMALPSRRRRGPQIGTQHGLAPEHPSWISDRDPAQRHSWKPCAVPDGCSRRLPLHSAPLQSRPAHCLALQARSRFVEAASRRRRATKAIGVEGLCQRSRSFNEAYRLSPTATITSDRATNASPTATAAKPTPGASGAACFAP